MGVRELVGNSIPVKITRVGKGIRSAPAGLQTNRFDDLDAQKHIIPKLNIVEGKNRFTYRSQSYT
jgi:hypothetical protein